MKTTLEQDQPIAEPVNTVPETPPPLHPAPESLPEPIPTRKVSGPKTAVILIVCILIGGLLYWQWHGAKAFLPYVTVLLPSFIAAGQVIFKDWDKYEPKWIRWLLLGGIGLAAAWGIYYQSVQIGEREAKETQAKAEKATSDALSLST